MKRFQTRSLRMWKRSDNLASQLKNKVEKLNISNPQNRRIVATKIYVTVSNSNTGSYFIIISFLLGGAKIQIDTGLFLFYISKYVGWHVEH